MSEVEYDRMREYEAEKKRLIALCLPADEYEQAVKALAARLGV